MTSLRVRYQTLEFGKTDIHVRTLRDTQEYADDDGAAEAAGVSSANWSLFGVVWPSAEVLAHLMFGYEVEGKRILEVGCGIGLASLVLNSRSADITATDYNPAAGDFLKENVTLNEGDAIPFVRTHWAEPETDLGKFDIIIGSDLLYDQWQVAQLSGFIDQHANPDCTVIIIDPGRKHYNRFSRAMVKLGYSHEQNKPAETPYLDDPFDGYVLEYTRQSDLISM